ncbi:hypothetical protein NBRC116494_30600 [Aurantivibrio plasticivorans]
MTITLPKKLTVSFALVFAATLGSSNVMSQKLYDGYKVPKNEFGQPDLQGFWTNVSLTTTTRPKEFGDRLVYTEEEVRVIEKDEADYVALRGEATDPNAGAEHQSEGDKVKRPRFQSAGGAVGGYNHFWINSGDRVMRVGGEPRTSLLTTKDGQIPKTKSGKPAPRYYSRFGFQDRMGQAETMSLGERCIIGFGRNAGPPMFPNGFYNNNYQIVQSADTVMILVEMNHDARMVRLNAEHSKTDARPYFGDSIGHWDGNTLVVETTNIPQDQAFYGSWKNLKVIEKFTRVAENRLHYAFSVIDPDVWAEPWGGEYEFSTLDGQIFEYACHEGNYALPNMLKGARLEEEKKAAAKK